MGLIIDISIIFILFICIYLGYKRGFIKVVTHLLSFFIALLVTLLFYKPLSTLIINTTTLDDKINNSIYSKIQDDDFSNLESTDSFSIYIENLVHNSKDVTAEYIASFLTTTIIEGISFISLFIAIKLILLVFNFMLDFISKLPIIKQFDKSGGIVYGILQGIVIIYVIFAIIYLVLPMCENMNILDYINNSYLGKFFYYDNLIIKQLLK